MPLDKAAVLSQIDEVLARYEQLETVYAKRVTRECPLTDLSDAPEKEMAEVRALLTHAIERFRPNGGQAFGAEALSKGGDCTSLLRKLAGILTALRAEYAADRLQSLREVIHADLFGDLLEQAEHLLDQGYKDAAAVTVGAVLEEHIRKLCGLHTVPTTTTDGAGKVHPKKLDTMNADLARAGCYNTIEQKDITAQAGIRNAAAHGEYAKYTAEQVRQMIGSIRGFIIRHPA